MSDQDTNPLRGELVELRARCDSDVAILQSELYDDIAARIRADTRAWRPLSPDALADSPYRIETTDDAASFSVIELGSGDLAGEAILWGIDTHNRAGHLGLALRPAFRGRGLGQDVLHVLCRFGFGIRGLHRLQLETISENVGMVRAAERAGFVHEGTLREAVWVDGAFAGVCVFGRVAPR